MKTNSKKIFTGVLGMTMVVQLLSPAVLFAQGTSDERKRERDFCVRFDEMIVGLDRRITDREKDLRGKHDAKDTRDAMDKRDINDKHGDRAKLRGENREEYYAKLNARATTEEQRQAVAAFKTAVESAISVRRAAVSSAVGALHEKIEETVAARKAAIEAAIAAFKNARTAAIEKAKADCASGIQPGIVRETFRTSMKTAQEQFKSVRQTIEQLRASLEPFRVAQRQAVQQAIATFKAAIDKARAELKAAFQE